MKLYDSKSLDLCNLISLRDKYYRHDFYYDIYMKKQDIADYIDDSESFMITIIHGSNNNLQTPEYDIEVMFRKSGKGVPKGGKEIEKLFIEDSICAELINEPEQIQKAIQALNDLALEKKLSIGKNVWVQYMKDDISYVYFYAEKK